MQGSISESWRLIAYKIKVNVDFSKFFKLLR